MSSQALKATVQQSVRMASQVVEQQSRHGGGFVWRAGVRFKFHFYSHSLGWDFSFISVPIRWDEISSLISIHPLPTLTHFSFPVLCFLYSIQSAPLSSGSNICATIHSYLIPIFNSQQSLLFSVFCQKNLQFKYHSTQSSHPLSLNLVFSQVGYQYQGGQGQHTSEQPGRDQQLQQGKEREGQFTQGLGWEHFYSSNGPSS